MDERIHRRKRKTNRASSVAENAYWLPPTTAVGGSGRRHGSETVDCVLAFLREIVVKRLVSDLMSIVGGISEFIKSDFVPIPSGRDLTRGGSISGTLAFPPRGHTMVLGAVWQQHGRRFRETHVVG